MLYQTNFHGETTIPELLGNLNWTLPTLNILIFNVHLWLSRLPGLAAVVEPGDQIRPWSGSFNSHPLALRTTCDTVHYGRLAQKPGGKSSGTNRPTISRVLLSNILACCLPDITWPIFKR